MALAAQAGDPVALTEAQAAYEAAAADAARADQALTIAIGETAAQIVRPASASSAVALRAVSRHSGRIGGAVYTPLTRPSDGLTHESRRWHAAARGGEGSGIG